MPQQQPLLAEELADEIRETITTEMEPGDRLPSEHTLAGEMATSRNTIRKALAILIHEGLIESHGKTGGYRVRTVYRRPFVVTQPARFSEPGDLEEHSTPVATTPVVDRQVPSSVIAELLRLRKDEPAVVHTQLHLVDGHVCGTSTTYLSDETATKVPQLAATNAAGLAALVQAAGYELVAATDKTLARMPTHAERSGWNIAQGVPVIEHRRIAWDGEGEVLYVTVNTLAADRYQLEHHLSSDDLGIPHFLEGNNGHT